MITKCTIYLVLFITTLLIYLNEIPKPLFLLGIPLVLLCFFVIERYVYNGFLYLLLHLLFYIPAIFVPFPTNIYKVLYVILLLMECSHAGYIWRHNSDPPYTEVPWFSFLLLVVVGIGARVAKNELILNIVFYAGILLLILHFVQYYLEGVRFTLIKAQNATSVPTRKMVVTSAILLSFVMVVFLFSSILIKGFNIDYYAGNVLSFLWKTLLAIIKWLLYIGTLIKAYFARNRELENLDKQKTAYEQAFQKVLEEISNPSVLAKIIQFALAIFVYYILIRLIYKMFKHIYKIYLNRYAKDSDIVTELSKYTDTVKKVQGPTILQRVKERFSNDNRLKLRQLYKFYINRHKEYFHKKSNTPMDIAASINELYNEDISEATNLYTKARYSSYDITQEDVTNLQLILGADTTEKKQKGENYDYD